MWFSRSRMRNRRRPRRKHYKPEALLKAGLPLEACLGCAQQGRIALVPIEKIGDHIAKKHKGSQQQQQRRPKRTTVQEPVATTTSRSRYGW